MGKYFGTDGFRGEANVDLNVQHAYQVGRYLGWYYGQEHKARIVIGKDTRRSSYMFEYALAAGLTASGADAYLLHVTTTPSVAYVVRLDEFDCGIMISASHNPYYDNGIKIISGSGQKIDAKIEEQIEKYIDGKLGEIPMAKREEIGRTTDYVAGRNRYIGYLISLATRSFKNFRIGLDCANGSSFSIAKSVFDALGAKTYVIANEPDGTNINRDCGSTHIENLVRLVKEEHLDLGFAYDGDADRCLAVDENGNVVDGDQIMYICGKYLKEQGRLKNNTIVTTIMSNLGLYKALDKIGIGYEKTQVGDKYVYENMLKNGNILGGEQSGHIIFSKHATTGDGILTSLMIMEVVIESKKTLGSLASEMRVYPQLLKNVRVYSKKETMENPAVNEAIANAKKELGQDGRILVRASGTEPKVRVMVEAESDEICAKYVYDVIAVMRRQNLIIPDGMEAAPEKKEESTVISEKMRELVAGSSVIRAMFEEGQRMAKIYGPENVYDFSLGNPNIPAPQMVNDAAKQILDQENPVFVHGYMNNSGYPRVRAAIADSLNRRFGTDFDENSIIMTVGAAGGLNVFFKTILNPGDEVLTFAPYFGEYRSYTANYDAVLKAVEPDEATYLPNLENLRNMITPKTRIVIINSPNNPTGVVYPEETIRGIAQVLLEKEKEYGISIYLVSDEPYRELAYDGTEVPYLTKYYHNTAVGYSFSKSLSLPGERIGYLVLPKEMDDAEAIRAGANVATRILGFVNAPSLMQLVIEKCLDARVNLDAYDSNRKALTEGLSRLGFSFIQPQGAFYLWVKAPDGDDKAFCAKGKEYHILMVPGSSFAGPGYVRIAYCVSNETIERSMSAFEKLAADYGLEKK